MAYGIDRKNGSVVNPAGFYGLQPVILKVAANSNQFTADTGGGTSAIVEGGYTKAIRAIGKIASIVYLGTRANGQFVVILDKASANPYVSANSDTNLAAAVKAEVEAAVATLTATVTDISGLVAGNLA
jgi:hypothetical protein